LTSARRVRLLAVIIFPLGSVAGAQSPLTDVDTGVSPLVCNPWKPQTFSANLSLAERACLGLSQLTGPGVLLGAGLAAGYARLHTPENRNESNNMAVHIGHIYERRAARATAEVLVGYWHHEDPKRHFSGTEGGWRRAKAALWSVVNSPDQDGRGRLALAPIAGSLGSGLTTMAFYQRQNSFGYGLERSGFVYGHYFASALLHEFSPELWSLAPHFIRKYHTAKIRP
jgi:hypothetical protein